MADGSHPVLGDDESYLLLLFVFTGNDTARAHHRHTVLSQVLNVLQEHVVTVTTNYSPLGILGALQALCLPLTFVPVAAGPEGPGEGGGRVARGQTPESVVNTELVETALSWLEN